METPRFSFSIPLGVKYGGVETLVGLGRTDN